MYLLDTNVVSELRKGGRADPGVRAFFDTLSAQEAFLAVQTLGEIRRGVDNLRGRGDRAQADLLEAWLDGLLSDWSSRILAFDLHASQVWGRLMSPHPQHAIDKQIAAIALIHDLTVVTRNTADFGGTGARVLNPFSG